VRIEGDGELTDEAGAAVGIEDLVQALGVVRGGLDDLALAEDEADILERDALVDGRAVIP
jgi:hypothetical protein